MNISIFKTEEDFQNAAPPQEGYYLRWVKQNEDDTVTEYIKDHTGTVQVLNAGGDGSGLPPATTDDVGKVLVVAGTGEFDENTLLLLHLDEADAQFVDSSSYNNVMTNSGIAYNASGKFGGCGTSNGAASLYCPGAVAFNFGSADWTVEVWFRTTNGNGEQMLINQRISESDNGAWSLRTGNLYYNAGGHNNLNHGKNFADGNWHHIAAVRNGTSMMIFFDGILSNSRSISSSQSFGFVDKNITIGKEPAVDLYFDGDIDEIIISKEARWTDDFTPPAAPYYGGVQLVWSDVLGDIEDALDAIIGGA